MPFYEDIQKLFLSDKYADATIKCGPTAYPIHRAIVCPQSEILERAFTIGMKETTTCVLDLTDDGNEVVENFISVLYTGNYEDPVFGKPKLPHTAALTDSKALKSRLCYLYDTPSSKWLCERDEATRKAFTYQHDNPKVRHDGHMAVLKCMRGAIQLYALGHRMIAPVVQMVALERLYHTIKIITDTYTFEEQCEGDCLFVGLVEGIDEIYNITWPDDKSECLLRKNIASFCVSHVSRSKSTLTKYLTGAMASHDDFLQDIKAEYTARQKNTQDCEKAIKVAQHLRYQM